MTGPRKMVPLALRFILFNVAMLAAFYFTGRLRPEWTSVMGVIAAFVLMNFVAWISSRHYKEWK